MTDRSTNDILSGKPEIVPIAGRNYEIPPRNVRDNLGWRKTCGTLISLLIDEASLDLLKKANDQKQKKENEEKNIEIGLGFFKMLLPKIMGEGYDLAIEMMFEYSPELAADREFILREGTDEEIINAIMVCLKFGFPFVLALIKGMLEGQEHLKGIKIGAD